MKRLIALGISIGVLAGLFTWFAFSVTSLGGYAAPFVVWVGFAAWAVFYAAGAGVSGLMKTLASTVSGLLWGWLIVWAWTNVGPDSMAVLGLFVGLAAFGMCVQATVPLLAFIPGAFIGAAAYFGNATIFWSTLISLVVGALLAFASERLADVIEKPLNSRRGSRREPSTAPA